MYDPNSINSAEFGFGYDSLSDDYKLLRMIQTRTTSRVFYREASVYSLKNDSWKCVIDPITGIHEMMQTEPGALVNETLHFIRGKMVDGNDGRWYKNLIQCFSLRDKTFLTLGLPYYNAKLPRYLFEMGNLGCCLCLMLNYLTPGTTSLPHNHLAFSLKLNYADFWVMKEYGKQESWVKLFSIHEPSNIGCFERIKPLMYSRDGERVLI